MQLHTDAPMKIRLTQEGFENYTGQMGILQFVDGLSTSEVPFKDATRMSAVMKCEFEDGSSCNPAERLLQVANMSVDGARETEDYVAPVETAPVAPVNVEQPVLIELAPVSTDTIETTVTYTREELAVVADEKGISGLRELAQPLGVKSNSINGLIEEILKKVTPQ